MIPAQLVGGPYDGDAQTIEQRQVPRTVFAWVCPDCQDIHWSFLLEGDEHDPARYCWDGEEPDSGERYRYVYGDLSSPLERAEELATT